MCLLAISPFVRVIGFSTVVLLCISIGVAFYLQSRVAMDTTQEKEGVEWGARA